MKHTYGLASVAVAIVGLGFAACGGAAVSRDGATGDAASADAAPAVDVVDVAPDVPFVTAMHNPLPQVSPLGGPSMTNVQLVIITYADDYNRAAEEAFGQWIGTSDWLHTIGRDYDMGMGSVLGVVERTDNAPDTMTNLDIETMIANGIADGSLPQPADHNLSNVLYMVFFPSHTTLTLQTSTMQPAETSCRDFGAYHSEVRRGAHVAYAAVPDCGGGYGGTDFDGITVAASHEYAEAASDPFPLTRPAYQLPADGSSAWAFIGGEIGDLCELTHSAYQDGMYWVQRIWSNSAANAGTDPCIPTDPARPYFNISVDPGDVQWASAGDTIMFTLTGWSVVPMSSWRISIQPQGGNIMMSTSLSSSTLNNGTTATLTVRVPASAPRGYEAFELSSTSTTMRNRQVWPLVVIVN